MQIDRVAEVENGQITKVLGYFLISKYLKNLLSKHLRLRKSFQQNRWIIIAITIINTFENLLHVRTCAK